MKESTLVQIANQLYRFRPVMDNICNLHDHNKELKVVSLLLSNISADTSHCVNHSHERSVKALNDTIKTLQSMVVYSGKHNPLLTYVVNEIEVIVEGETMTAEYE